MAVENSRRAETAVVELRVQVVGPLRLRVGVVVITLAPMWMHVLHDRLKAWLELITEHCRLDKLGINELVIVELAKNLSGLVVSSAIFIDVISGKENMGGVYTLLYGRIA